MQICSLEALLCCIINLHSVCLIALLELNATQRNAVYRLCTGFATCPSVGAFYASVASACLNKGMFVFAVNERSGKRVRLSDDDGEESGIL